MVRRLGWLVLSVALLTPGVPAYAAESAAAECKIAATAGPDTLLSEGFPTGSRHPKSTGTLSAIALFVDFPDAPGTGANTIDSEMKLLFDPAIERVRTSSAGRLTLTVHAHDKWLHMPQVSWEYVNTTHEGQKALLTDAVMLAHFNDKVDFSRYDVVYMVPSSKAADAAGMGISPTFIRDRGDGIEVGGHEITAGVTFGRDRFGTGGGHNITMHETGHILGLPDLYKVGVGNPAQHSFVGSWDMMGELHAGPEFMTWHKWKLGWLDDDRLYCVTGPTDTTVELTPNGDAAGTQAVVVRLDSHTAYVAEVRQQTGNDTNQCSAGVLVYKVDADIATGTGPVKVNKAQDKPKDAFCTYPVPGELAFATYRRGEGRNPVFRDAAENLTITVIGNDADGTTTVQIKK